MFHFFYISWFPGLWGITISDASCSYNVLVKSVFQLFFYVFLLFDVLYNSYFDSSVLSKLLVTTKLLNLNIFKKYVVHLLFNDMCHGIFSEWLFHS